MKSLKLLCERILAVLITGIPFFFAVYGWKWMRDILYNFFAGQPFAWLPFLGSLILFLSGIVIIGSLIYYRDKKRKHRQRTHREPLP